MSYSKTLFHMLLLIAALSLNASSVMANPEATGGVKLKWTAPGDDGSFGRAAKYIIRYQPLSKGPLNTESEWTAATTITAFPIPSPAGQKDSALILGLNPGSGYYFAIKARDEAGNWSLLSSWPLKTAISMVCCSGRVGDADGIGGDEPTISDVLTLIDHMFISKRALWCPSEADVNQSGGDNPQQGPGGDITISDVAMLVAYLFSDGPPLFMCR